MADTLFSSGTVIVTPWLNDANTSVYNSLTAVSAGPNNITATGPNSLSLAYPTGSLFKFIPQATNNAQVTLNINNLGARAITKYGATLLVAGDLVAGATALVIYDGAGFQLINPGSVPANVSALPGRLINTQTFLASGTFTPTPGATRWLVKGQGAGGAGGGAAATAAGAVSVGIGGGAGSIGEAYITNLGGPTVAVTIGAGGTGNFGVTGGPGGLSSFGAFLILNGGGGGNTAGSASVTIAGGAAGGAAGTGNILAQPGQSSNLWGGAFAAAYIQSGQGAGSLYGSAGGSNGNGTAALSGGSGLAASGRAAGGGGAYSTNGGGAQIGGVGAPGIIIVYEYT